MAKRKTTAMTFPVKAHLRERNSGAKVSATIRPMSAPDLAQWSGWAYGNDDQDTDWEWNKILKESGKAGGRIECYALYVGDQLHGLVSFDLRGHSTKEGRGLIVDYLATNPDNRRGSRGMKDVGKVFLGLAVYRSRELGWDGRLWLESLSKVERFYEYVGFTKLQGRSKAGNVAFELGKAAADRIWRDILAEKTLSVSD